MLVSILLPVRKYNPRITSSLDSLVCQSYAPLEIVIVFDDIEPRALSEVLVWKEKWDKRATEGHNTQALPTIKLLVNPNPKNLSRALNFGLIACSGTWIARADADDVYSPNRVEKQLREIETLENTPAAIGVLSQKISGDTVNNSYVALKPMDFLFRNPIIHSSVVVKKEILEANPYDERFTFSQDYELWTRLICTQSIFATEQKLVDLDQSDRAGRYVLSQERFFLKANIKFLLRLLKHHEKSVEYILLFRAFLQAGTRYMRLILNILRLKMGRW